MLCIEVLSSAQGAEQMRQHLESPVHHGNPNECSTIIISLCFPNNGIQIDIVENGELPWLNDTKHKAIQEKKEMVPMAAVCNGLPSEMTDIACYIYQLQFEDRLDYGKL